VKSSDLFVKALENEGVQYVFGIPGEENLDLLDSLSRSDSITRPTGGSREKRASACRPSGPVRPIS